MIGYRYEPGQLERRHEDFVRRGAVALGGPLRDAFPEAAEVPRAGDASTASHDRRERNTP
ncbi:hypothetical protein ACIRFH_09955 [Streptomyces sp. NPDC093586]|uniref:hypothetical protein n=1 Tax=Streptomyces sp. NPDC093586 TaxID=3366042 RepID=UPI0038223FBD